MISRILSRLAIACFALAGVLFLVPAPAHDPWRVLWIDLLLVPLAALALILAWVFKPAKY